MAVLRHGGANVLASVCVFVMAVDTHARTRARAQTHTKTHTHSAPPNFKSFC